MTSLVKVMLTLGSLFALSFIAGRLLGILTVENVQAWLEWAGQVDPVVVATIVVFLLFADLFVAVPTLTITILAGYFLGFPLGAAAAFAGMVLAAFTGYGISRVWGQRAIAILIKDADNRYELTIAFQTGGPVMIMLSRAAPIVTEVCACMAGATGMSLRRYCAFFAIGTFPYVLIAAYAGSVSSFDDPAPAIIAILVLNAGLWAAWAVFRRRDKEQCA